MRWIVMGLVMACTFALPTTSYAKRVALVIGNNEYEFVSKLDKAVNDAEAMSTALKGVGFDVIYQKDVTRRQFSRNLQQFLSQLGVGDEALIFYAGHGIEIQGQVFLLPTDIPDAEPGQEAFVKSEAISMLDVLDELNRRKVRLSVLILDACRNNPFKQSGKRSLGLTRGLGSIAAPPEGTFILYSAGQGQAALDRLSDNDPHPNSVFTRTLLPMIKKPGLKISEAAKSLRLNVMELAMTVSHKQTPAYYDQIIGEFYFTPPAADVSKVAPPTEEVIKMAQNNPYAKGTCGIWPQIATTATYAQVEAFLAECKSGIYAKLANARLKELKPTGKLALLPPAVKKPAVKKPPSGDAEAIFNKAWNIYNGKNGEKQDYFEAVRLYRQAAELGHSSAKVNLGYAYENGHGVQRDYYESVRYYKEAAEEGETQGMTNLGYMYEQGFGLERNLTQAVYWYRKAAEKGNANGMTNLGYMLEMGRGTAKNYNEAFRWYKKGADTGLARAQNNLAYMYLNGRGVTKNYNTAYSLYQKSANQRFPNAMYMIGYMHELGYGVRRNGKAAAPWVLKALKARHQFSVKEMTTNANGWSVDFRKELQRLLAKEGYYQGSIDGNFGQGTFDAVRSAAGQ